MILKTSKRILIWNYEKIYEKIFINSEFEIHQFLYEKDDDLELYYSLYLKKIR